MLKSVPLPALVLALAACGGSPAANQAEPAASASPTPAANVAEQVRAMPAGQRDGVLFRAIVDAGQACQGVTESEFVGEDEGRLVWMTTCSDRANWLVALAPDGTAIVTDRQGRPGAAAKQ